MADSRLFFALWPPAGVAETLAAWADDAAGRFGGRPTRRDTLHLTLAFLGSVSPTQANRACECAQGLVAPAFTWSLDCLRGWPRHGIVWAGARQPPAALVGLGEALQDGLREQGLVIEARPFQPHVTLLRRAARFPDDETLPSCAWPTGEFVLVASVSGAPGGGLPDQGSVVIEKLTTAYDPLRQRRQAVSPALDQPALRRKGSHSNVRTTPRPGCACSPFPACR